MHSVEGGVLTDVVAFATSAPELAVSLAVPPPSGKTVHLPGERTWVVSIPTPRAGKFVLIEYDFDEAKTELRRIAGGGDMNSTIEIWSSLVAGHITC